MWCPCIWIISGSELVNGSFSVGSELWCDYIWVSCDSEMVHGWLRFGSAWCGTLCLGSAMGQIRFSVDASVVQGWFRSSAYSVYMVQQ